MKKLRAIAATAPLRTAFAVLVLVEALFLAPYVIFGRHDATGGTQVIGYDLPIGVTVSEWIYVGFIIALVGLFGWFRQTGLTATHDPAGPKALYWVGAFPAAKPLCTLPEMR